MPLVYFVVVWYGTNMEYAHEGHSVHWIVYHIIFCPKRRRKILIGPIPDRLQHMIQEVIEEHHWSLIERAIQPDHVHLFIRSNPYRLPTDIARLMKGRSAHVLREEFPALKRLPSLWTRSTFYSTAGNVRSEIIQKDMERQSKSSC